MPAELQIISIIFGTLGGVGALSVILFFRLKGKELEMQRGSDAELGPVVDALRDDVDDTRAQLADMQERLDFTERVLSEVRSRNAIGPGDST